ncbi:MAG: TonB-dependent receptor [Candidatus Omnitrophica bacterium]|jgi:iron complex outermembrane receptor protein|nr:TonB-dependent receptor [Candidatus Omnitrophota bacterium]
MPRQIKAKFIIFFYLFCSLSTALGQEEQALEKITVRRNRSGFSQEFFNKEEINQRGTDTPVDILNYTSGLDLRSRSSFGIQSDISLRGSTYEQVAVMIDSVRVMDAQTGHYNLDIPLTNFDIEQVEVTKNAASSLYGSGAFAGGVNFAVKKPVAKAFNLETSFGQNVLFGQAFSYSLPFKDNLSARVSFDHKIAKAARSNTDFEYKTGTFYLNKDFSSSSLNTLFGWQEKDYGADSFYSNMFPEEEEHTKTLFTSTNLDSELAVGKLKNSLYLRRHRDKFILNRNNPVSVNYHTTYTYGLNNHFDLPTGLGNFSFGLDAARDEINSTNLGKHSRIYEAGLLGFNSQINARLDTDFRLRFDHYQKWPWQESFNLGLGYKILEQLKLKGSFAKAFRIPTFTELYYSDAANKGDPNLGIEKSDTFTLGLNLKDGIFDLLVEGFLRRGHNLIDWTRATSNVAWQATNLGRVDFYGVAIDAKCRLEAGYAALRLNGLNFSYNYTSADKKTSGFYSKYALDILMHQFISSLDTVICGLKCNWQLSYSKRYYDGDYFLGSIYISRKIVKNNFNFEPFLKVDNFTNKKYSEVAGVVQPGRWIQGGLKLEW